MIRILYIMEWYSNEIHKGIARYCGEHGWHLNAKVGLGSGIPSTWDGDGIITGAPENAPALQRLVKNTSAQIVYISAYRNQTYRPSICPDNEKIARLAAEHFLGKGFKRFLCYFDPGSKPSLLRRDTFVESVKGQGGHIEAVAVYGDWIERVQNLRSQLEAQRFPIAIFATEDEYASDITEACEAEGLRVPEDVAILGVNNDETYCLACGVPISSIDNNLFELGYQAAALLANHIQNKDLPSQHHTLVHSPHVITRRSTDVLAVDNPGVAKALRLINARYTEPVQIADIVKAAGMSRASLFNAFRADINRTPNQEVIRLRLEHAKRLLLETRDSLDSIAFDAGFQTAHNMYVAFRRDLGISPSAFRKREDMPSEIT